MAGTEKLTLDQLCEKSVKELATWWDGVKTTVHARVIPKEKTHIGYLAYFVEVLEYLSPGGSYFFGTWGLSYGTGLGFSRITTHPSDCGMVILAHPNLGDPALYKSIKLLMKMGARVVVLSTYAQRKLPKEIMLEILPESMAEVTTVAAVSSRHPGHSLDTHIFSSKLGYIGYHFSGNALRFFSTAEK